MGTDTKHIKVTLAYINDGPSFAGFAYRDKPIPSSDDFFIETDDKDYATKQAISLLEKRNPFIGEIRVSNVEYLENYKRPIDEHTNSPKADPLNQRKV